MSSLSIPSGRVQQVTKTITTLVDGYHIPLDSDAAVANFTSLFDENAEWYDHAFLIRRVGHEAILGLHKSFNYCNQPFRAEVKSLHPTTTGAVIEQVWHGTCANDIVRPDGQVVVKAHGKTFACHVCMVIDVNDAGKITRIGEYYTKIWEDGIAREQYFEMRGASLKEGKI